RRAHRGGGLLGRVLRAGPRPAQRLGVAPRAARRGHGLSTSMTAAEVRELARNRLIESRLTPNAISIAGLIGNIVAAVLVWQRCSRSSRRCSASRMSGVRWPTSRSESAVSEGGDAGMREGFARRRRATAEQDFRRAT